MGRYSATEINAIDRDNRAMNAAGVPMSGELEEIFDAINESSLGATAAGSDIDSLCLGGGAFTQDADTTAGLTFGYQAGRFHNGSSLINVAAGTVLLAPSQTNYIQIDRAGAITSNTAGFTAGQLPLYVVITGAASIVSVASAKPLLCLIGNGGVTGAMLSAAAGLRSIEQLIGAVAATGGILFVAPVTGKLAAVTFSNATAIATSDVDYWQFTLLNRGPAGAGAVDMLDTGAGNSTKATGGSALVAKGSRSLTLNATPANLNVNANDVLELTITKTGAPAALAGATARLDFSFTG